jgi:hypothetical protein
MEGEKRKNEVSGNYRLLDSNFGIQATFLKTPTLSRTGGANRMTIMGFLDDQHDAVSAAKECDVTEALD